MYCSKCGKQVPDNAGFCVNCGQALAGPPVSPPPAVTPPAAPPNAIASPAGHYAAPPPGATYSPPPPAGTFAPQPGGVAGMPYVPPGQAVYVPSPFAGFWLRFVALIIDSIILVIGAATFIAVVVAIIGLGTLQNAFENSDNTGDFLPASIIMGILIVILGLTVGQWLYFAWMESSSNQGTFGKMALGLIVTDMQGRRVSFGRATGRYFSKIITGLIPFGIGYIMAGFTEKKQALHDMIASCLVLRKS